MLDPIVILIARKEVESQDISRILSMLKTLLSNPETAKEHFEKIDIAFHGYDDDTRELFEIPEAFNRSYSELIARAYQSTFCLIAISGKTDESGLKCKYRCSTEKTI